MENVTRELPKPKEVEGMSQYRPPLCFELTGQTFELVMDNGYDYTLSFKDRKVLTFCRCDEEPKEYAYDCLKADDETYFVNFEKTGAVPRTGITFILDLEQSLVTANFITVGQNPRYPKMPKTEIIFGAIKKEDGTVPTVRHGYTTFFLDKAIRWDYGNLVVIHIYSSEHYYRLGLPEEAVERMRRENPERAQEFEANSLRRLYEEPADYIKIKDGIYVFNMTEEMSNRERGQGNNLFFLMNLDRLYDVGRSFGHNGDGLPENYTYGAYGKYVDASEVLARKSTEYIR